MKSRYILYTLCALAIAGCSFLEERIESSSTPGSYYKTEIQCRSGLNGCYVPMRNVFSSRSFFWLTEAQGDLLYTEQADQYDGILQVTQSQPQYGATVWKECYTGIMRCNSMYDAITRAPFTDGKEALLAECTVLRAMYWYLLTCTFGDVPYYEVPVTEENNDSIARLPRERAAVIRDRQISALDNAIMVSRALPFEKTYSPSNGGQYRMGAAAGLMLAGKLCMWEKRWGEAIVYYSRLEDIYGDLSQYPVSDSKFRNKYTGESVWEIPFMSGDYSLQVFHNLSTICIPTHTSTFVTGDEENYDNANDIYAGIAVPELGFYARNNTPTRPTRKLYNSATGLLPYNAGAGDLRACSSNSTGDIEGGGGSLAWGWMGWKPDEDRTTVQRHWNWFSGMSSQSRPYLGDKFWCYDMRYQSDCNNLKVFRYAGAVLDLAEASLEQGDPADAVKYLNYVKQRAGTALFDQSLGEDALMEEIRNESGRELLGEFQRKFNLVRWGIWYETVRESREGNNVSQSNFLANMRPCHRYYPIPSEQITYSGGALSNPEYEKYGK